MTPARGFLHIVGNRDNGNLVDLVKFVFNTNDNTLSSPVVLITSESIRTAYDICVLNAGFTFVVAAVTDPQQILRSSGLVATKATL
jgi:hypothetical protein